MAKFPRIFNIQKRTVQGMYTWILAFLYMNDMCFNLGQMCGLSSQCTSNQTAACTWFRTEETINYILWKCILKSIFLNILLTTLQKPTKHTHNVNMHSPCDQFLVSRGLVIVWRRCSLPFLCFLSGSTTQEITSQWKGEVLVYSWIT